MFLDRRILSLDPQPEEVIASDQKRLIVDAYARFRIVDPLKFYISVGNEAVARSRLATIINSRIRNVLGKQSLATLLSEERSKQMAIIQEGVNTEAEKFGITIIDIRIKRADLPQANSEAIYKRMQTEREREAKQFRARGAEMAVTITSTADKEVTVILANANKESEIMKGEGDGIRNNIFAECLWSETQNFLLFIGQCKLMKPALIGGETSLILSPDSDFFKFFGNTGINQKLNNKFNERASNCFWFITLYRRSFVYALFPSKMKNMLKTIEKMEVNQLRTGGLIFTLIGFAIIWYYKS